MTHKTTQTIQHSGTLQGTTCNPEVSRLYPALHDFSIDIGCAFRVAKTNGILPSDLDPSCIPQEVLNLLWSRAPACLTDPLDKATQSHLQGLIKVYSTAFGRPIYTLPIDGRLLAVDFDLLASDPVFASGINNKEYLFSATMILSHLLLRIHENSELFSKPLPLPLEVQHMLAESISLTATGTRMERCFESPIKHIAFPSQRDAASLRKCLESYIRSFFTYFHTPPALWVFDEADLEVQVEKRKMCDELSQQYGVVIHHIGAAEREKFLCEIFNEGTALPETTQNEIRQLCFAERKLGSNRNLIQLFFSGQIYSTVDDDTTSETTIADPLGPNGTGSPVCGRCAQALMPVAVKLISKLTATKFEANDDQVLRKAAAFCARVNHEIDLNPSDLMVRVLQELSSLFRIGVPALTNAQRKQFEREVASHFHEYFPAAIKRVKETVEGPLTVIEEDFACVSSYFTSHIAIPVDPFGTHSRMIGVPSVQLSAIRTHRTEGGRLFVGEKSPELAGSIGIISSNVNWSDAGSQQNTCQAFEASGELATLQYGKLGRFISFPSHTLIADWSRVSTTTYTTFDLRHKSGLIVSGGIDSQTLGWAVQSGDVRFKLASIPLALDHFRTPSVARKFEPFDVGYELTQELLTSTSSRIAHGSLSETRGLEIFTANIYDQIFSLGVFGTNQSKAGRLELVRAASGIVSGIYARCGITGFPTIRELEIKAMRMAVRNTKSTSKKSITFDLHMAVRAILAIKQYADPIKLALSDAVLKTKQVKNFSSILHARARTRAARLAPLEIYSPEQSEA